METQSSPPSLCLDLSAGAVTGSCTWSSRSLVMGSSSWERTVLRLTPSLKSFITTPQTNCPSAEPNTCLCSSRCWCRHSEATHTHHALTHTQGLTRTATSASFSIAYWRLEQIFASLICVWSARLILPERDRIQPWCEWKHSGLVMTLYWCVKNILTGL